MAKRWKVSDIVGSALGDGWRASVASEAKMVARRCASNDGVVAELCRVFDLTMPKVCGLHSDEWLRMTHEERCDALVATARRLNVPRRA